MLAYTTEHETIQARRAPTYFKSVYQAWGWEKFHICTCGLDHSGSEPFYVCITCGAIIDWILYHSVLLVFK